MSKVKDGMRVRVKAREASAEEAKNGRYAPYLSDVTGTILKVYSEKEIAVNVDLDSLHPDIVARHEKQQQAMHQKWLDSLSEEARNRLTPEEKAFRLNYIVLLAESDLLTGKAAEVPAKNTGAAQIEQAPSTTASVVHTSSSEKKAAEMHSATERGATEGTIRSRGKTQAESRAKEHGKAAEIASAQTKGESARPAGGSQRSKTSSANLETKTAGNPQSKSQTVEEIPTPKRLTSADLEAQEEKYLKSKRKRV